MTCIIVRKMMGPVSAVSLGSMEHSVAHLGFTAETVLLRALLGVRSVNLMWRVLSVKVVSMDTRALTIVLSVVPTDNVICGMENAQTIVRQNGMVCFVVHFMCLEAIVRFLSSKL